MRSWCRGNTIVSKAIIKSSILLDRAIMLPSEAFMKYVHDWKDR